MSQGELPFEMGHFMTSTPRSGMYVVNGFPLNKALLLSDTLVYSNSELS